jgi:hypothetical protein
MQYPKIVMFPAQIDHHRGPRPTCRLSSTHVVGSMLCALPRRQRVFALMQQYLSHRKLDGAFLF